MKRLAEQEITRRSFVGAIGAGSVMVPLLTTGARASARETAAIPGDGRASVGYVLGSGAWKVLDRERFDRAVAERSRVSPAASLGSKAIKGKIEARVLGTYGSPDGPVELTPLFHVAGEDLPFYAFSAAPEGSSAGVSFRMPGADGLRFRVGNRAGPHIVTLSTSGTGPQLRRGIYLLGVDPKAWRVGGLLDAAPPRKRTSIVVAVVSRLT